MVECWPHKHTVLGLVLGIVPQAYNLSTLDIICSGSELQQELLARDGGDGGTDTKGWPLLETG